MTKDIHIGRKIAELLHRRRITRQELGRRIGVTPSMASYLCKRRSIDVQTLHKISLALRYNFFQHYPIEEKGLTGENDGQNKASSALKAANAELHLLRQENAYLKELYELLKEKLES